MSWMSLPKNMADGSDVREYVTYRLRTIIRRSSYASISHSSQLTIIIMSFWPKNIEFYLRIFLGRHLHIACTEHGVCYLFIWSADKREKKCHFFYGFVKSLAHCKREHNRSAKGFTILIAFEFLFEATLIIIIWFAAFGFGLFTRTDSMRLGDGSHLTHTGQSVTPFTYLF